MNMPSAPSPLMVPNPPGGPSASALLKSLQDAGVTHAVTVPDFVQFALHDKIFAADSGIASVLACAEDQALTTATGLHIGGAVPVVMVQNQGMFKVANTLRATCIDAGIPMVFFVGQFGREAGNVGKPMSESGRSMVRLLEPTMQAMGVRCFVVDDDADIPQVAEAFAHAKSAETAAVVVIGRHVTWN
ncbi:thiamine pyrophosphate-binding protein [Variovorax robiniae]|uniref:Thiamine pyrophosphate-binding protein n=1 Tax=Variovorax robiniae TaxID=1836199 RepID=A0ABU8XE89_9BURK